jgi:hypothetical protein
VLPQYPAKTTQDEPLPSTLWPQQMKKEKEKEEKNGW